MSKKKYLLYLINPYQKYKHYSASTYFANLLGKKATAMPLSLPTLASFTPDNYEIKIINEEFQKLPKKKPDLVGITSISSSVYRAYEIGDYYKSINVPVIMGGTYVSFMVEEALKHCDSVVIGEAENIWQRVLKDFENNNLKKTYKAEKNIDFKIMPKPRWDLVDTKKLMSVGVQVTRGCPFNCDFCVVHKTFERVMKFRDLDNIIEEIKTLPRKTVFFVDDNLTINKKYAKELMKRIKPLGLTWLCQASIEVADDEELLNDMYEAGCMFILIGFESLNPASLSEANKTQNTIEKYERGIERIHKAGMQIMASFVIGFDNDTVEELDRIYDFTLKNNLPFIVLSILTPNPGTDLFDRLKVNNRLYGADPSIMNGTNPCMHYMNMSQLELFEKFHDTLLKLYDYDVICKKTYKLLEYENFRKMKSKIEDVSIFEKIRTSFIILNRFYFTKNKLKKKLFLDMFNLARTGKMSFDKVAFYLLSIEGFAEDIKEARRYYNELKEKIKLVDRGPWAKIINNYS